MADAPSDIATKLKLLILRRATGQVVTPGHSHLKPGAEFESFEEHGKPYKDLRALLLEDPALAGLVPRFVKNAASLTECWTLLKSEVPSKGQDDYARRRAYIEREFAPLMTSSGAPPAVTPIEPVWWALMHPRIKGVSQSRFEAGHLADAVEAAMKEVNVRVKNHARAKGGKELDGADLMHKAFSPRAPMIKLGDMETISGASEQQGYMQIFAGAMEALRNPKAHANVTIDEPRAIHHLFVASLLMYKLDEAGVS